MVYVTNGQGDVTLWQRYQNEVNLRKFATTCNGRSWVDKICVWHTYASSFSRVRKDQVQAPDCSSFEHILASTNRLVTLCFLLVQSVFLPAHPPTHCGFPYVMTIACISRNEPASGLGFRAFSWKHCGPGDQVRPHLLTLVESRWITSLPHESLLPPK